MPLHCRAIQYSVHTLLPEPGIGDSYAGLRVLVTGTVAPSSLHEA